MPAVLFHSKNDSPKDWEAGLAKFIPNLEEKQIYITPNYKKKLKSSTYIKPNKDNTSLF